MSLKLTYLEVKQRIGEYLGVGSAPTGTELTTVTALVKRGYRQALAPIDPTTGIVHPWRFMERTTTLSTATGVDTYDMPVGYMGMVGPLRFVTPQAVNPIERTYDEVLEFKGGMPGNSFPIYYAIKTGDFDSINGQKYQMVFYPTPSSDVDYYYTYTVMPPSPVNDADVFVGDEFMAEAILETCLAVAEEHKYDTPSAQNPGVHARAAQRLMLAAIGIDKKRGLVPNMGRITDGVTQTFVRYNTIVDQSGTQVVPAP